MDTEKTTMIEIIEMRIEEVIEIRGTRDPTGIGIILEEDLSQVQGPEAINPKILTGGGEVIVNTQGPVLHTGDVNIKDIKGKDIQDLLIKILTMIPISEIQEDSRYMKEGMVSSICTTITIPMKILISTLHLIENMSIQGIWIGSMMKFLTEGSTVQREEIILSMKVGGNLKFRDNMREDENTKDKENMIQEEPSMIEESIIQVERLMSIIIMKDSLMIGEDRCQRRSQ